MEVRSSLCAVVVGALGVSGSAWGGLTYQTQDRSITATTTADGASQTISSPDFARFLATIDLATTFQTPGGGTGRNNAHAGIDCQLDPNALVINGALFGAGGLSAGNGSPKLELGEASAAVSTTFHLDFASPFSLFASARPSTRAGDRFKIKLKNETSGQILASIDQNSPPTELNLAGEMAAGDYSLEYQVEQRVEGDEVMKDIRFDLRVPSPAGLGLFASAGVFALRRRRTNSPAGSR